MASPITFGAYGTDYAADQATIDRQQKLADMLQQQSMQPLGQESIGGVAIRRSPLEGLAQLAKAYAGTKVEERATASEKELSRKYAQGLADTLKAAQADPANAGQILMQHPATQQIGLTQMQQEMQNQRRQAILARVLGGNQPVPSATPPAGTQTPMQGPNGQPVPPYSPQGAGTPSASSGAALGIPDKITQLMMSGDPEMVALGKSILESSKGIAQRPGAPVVNPFTGQVIAQPTPSVPPGVQLNVGPNGPVASQVPGAQQAMAGITASQAGAEAGGKLPYAPPTVVQTPGRPTLMTPTQQIQAATGAPPPPIGAPTQPIVAPKAGQSPQSERVRILQDEYTSTQARPAGSPADQERKAADLAGLTRELTALKSAPPAPVPGLPLQDQGENAQQIAGGKSLAELQYEAPQARAAVADGVSNLQRLREQAEKIKNDPALSRITGVTGMFPNMPGGHAADVQARLDTLKSQAGFGALQAMRAASKTGGALGSVSDRENDLLQRNIGALDKAQSESAIKESLQQIIDYADAASMRLHRAYQDQYERVQGNQGMQVTPKGAVSTQSNGGKTSSGQIGNQGWSIKRTD